MMKNFSQFLADDSFFLNRIFYLLLQIRMNEYIYFGIRQADDFSMAMKGKALLRRVIYVK